MSDLIETLTSYVPTLVARRLATDPTPPTQAEAESLPAAVLFADISGFTALTERLAQRGPAGIEELTHLLNEYFGQLIDLINIYGGDVFKFAGDALLALWPARMGLMVTTEAKAKSITGCSSGRTVLLPPAAAKTALAPSTSWASSWGSIDIPVSGPGQSRLMVKCFSTAQAPRAMAPRGA